MEGKQALWLILSLLLITVTARAERINMSSSAGLFWSTAKEDEDLLRKPESNDDSAAAAVVNDHDEIDGGFSSLDGMLQWAIGIVLMNLSCCCYSLTIISIDCFSDHCHHDFTEKLSNCFFDLEIRPF